MDNYLLIQKNSRIFLLIRYTDRYHIITVNNKLDEDKEERVIAGGCSDAVIDEMGLTRETILKTDLRGVAIGGCHAGDAIILYTKDKKLKYVLSDDYTDADMDAMFSGIERFQPPKNGSKKRREDWRIAMQDASQRKIMASIGTVLNVIVCASIFGMFWFKDRNTVWKVLCLLLPAVAMGLYFAYPQYYTIMVSKDYRHAGYKAQVKHLGFAMAAPTVALMIQNGRFHYPDWRPLLLACAVTSVAVVIALYRFSREVRDHADYFLVALLFCLCASYGIVGQVNHLADFDKAEPRVCTVAETRVHEAEDGDDSFYCTVLLDTGEKMELPISRSVYNQLLPGDRVSVFSGKGALGIEYAYFVAKE